MRDDEVSADDLSNTFSGGVEQKRDCNPTGDGLEQRERVAGARAVASDELMESDGLSEETTESNHSWITAARLLELTGLDSGILHTKLLQATIFARTELRGIIPRYESVVEVTYESNGDIETIEKPISSDEIMSLVCSDDFRIFDNSDYDGLYRESGKYIPIRVIGRPEHIHEYVLINREYNCFASPPILFHSVNINNLGDINNLGNITGITVHTRDACVGSAPLRCEKGWTGGEDFNDEEEHEGGKSTTPEA